MKESDLWICCGHGGGDPGSVANGETESNMVRKIAKDMKLISPKINVMETSKDHYKEKTFSRINLPKNAVVCELHMDGFNNINSRGGHVIIYSDFEPDNYDVLLAKNISELLPGRASSIIKRDDLYNVNQCAIRGINYRMLECGFITNSSDFTFVKNNIRTVSKAILKSFGIVPEIEEQNNDVNKLKKEIQNILDKY